MRCLLFPVGSYGDVHPYVGLGLELQARGHEVIVCTSEHFRSLCERVGLTFEAIDTQEEFEATIGNPRLFHPLRGMGTLARQIMIPWQRRQFDFIRQNHLPGETVIVGSLLGLGLSAAREVLGVPWVSVHLQPMLFWSDLVPPRVTAHVPVGPNWPPTWNRALFSTAVWIMLDRIVRRPINDFRRELNLPPVRTSSQLWHSPDKVLGLFPEWFAPPQPDWPAHTVLTGFPLWDESHDTHLDDDLEAFLAAGPPPVAFTPGSAMLHGQRFFETAAQACEQAGLRGLLLTRFPERQLPQRLPPGVRHVRYAPFSRLLPRCAALVYHGGIGTLSQACAAGVPHLIMPMSHDQPDNAARIHRLGVGDEIRQRSFTPTAVANKLRHLTQSAEVHQACQQVKTRMMNQPSGLTIAANEVEAALAAQPSLAEKSF